MKPKTFKKLSWVGIILILIIAAGLGIRALVNYTNGRKLNHYLADLKSRGRLPEISSLVAQCNDQENAAIVWKTAESLNLILNDQDKELLAELTDISTWRTFSPEEKNRLESIIEKNKKLIELILEASGKKCFLYDDINKELILRRLPKYTPLIRGARLLIVDSIIKSEEGQIEEATEQILKLLAFSKLIAGASDTISFNISMTVARMLIHSLNRIIEGRDLPVDILVKTMEMLDADFWRKAMIRSFEYEKIYALETFKIIQKNVIVSDDVGLGNPLYWWIFKPVLKSELIWILERYEELIKNAQQPFYKNYSANNWGYSEVNIPSRYKLANLLLIDPYPVVVKEATLEAMIDAARTGLACRLYLIRTGRLPEKLDYLVPEILNKVPEDPFTGLPLIYKSKNGSFIIYSLGLNRKDEEGMTSQLTQTTPEKGDDWGWRENWK